MDSEDSLNDALVDALEEIENLNWSVILLRMEISSRGEEIMKLRSQNELLKSEIRSLQKENRPKQVAAILKNKEPT